MGVAAQRAALIDVVLLHQRQQQHAINVANVQLFNLGGDSLTLISPPSLSPSVQVCLHPWCYHLKAHQQHGICKRVGLLSLSQNTGTEAITVDDCQLKVSQVCVQQHVWVLSLTWNVVKRLACCSRKTWLEDHKQQAYPDDDLLLLAEP